MSNFSEFDASLGDTIPPPTRSCFRALLNGPTARSNILLNHSHNHHHHHQSSQHGNSHKEDKSSNGSGYGLLDHANSSAFPFEDSFFSTTTGRTESTASGGRSRRGNGHNGHNGGGKNKHNAMSAICIKNPNERKKRGNNNRGMINTNISIDNRTIGSASNAGLLDHNHHNQFSNRAVMMDALDRRDAQTWKTTKTTTSSSVATSSHQSRMSRKSGTGAFPGLGYDSSFDFVEVDDIIPRNSIGKSLISCVTLKKNKHPFHSHGNNNNSNNGHKSSKKHGKKNNKDKDQIMMSTRKIIVEEPLPPEIPDSPQFFKFHNALPTHTVQNTDFPQIIFADNDIHANTNNNHNDPYFGGSTNGGNNGHNDPNNEFQPVDEGLSSVVEMRRTNSDIVNPFSQIKNNNNINTPFTPSPIRSSRRKSFDYSQSSPKSTRSMSRAGSRNPSPKSIRSRKEEEIFLDRLVNTVTAYNSYQEERNQQPSSGRKVLNHLIIEETTHQYPTAGNHTPEYVEVDNEDYSDDDVSSVGMISTSGGRRDTPEKQIIMVDKKQQQLQSNTQQQQQQQQPSPPFMKKKNPNDYFDPTIKQIKRGKNHSDNAAAKIKNVDERSLKWRMREADKQTSSSNILSSSPHRCPTREFMETGMSLMDRDRSNSFQDDDFNQENNQNDDGEDVDPTYAFGGSGIRKPPLALSEAFEDFGIDDRIYAREHRPGDTFDEDDPRTRSMQQFPMHDQSQQQQQQSNQLMNMELSQRLNKTSDGVLVSPTTTASTRGTPRSRVHEESKRKNLMNSYIMNHHSQNMQPSSETSVNKSTSTRAGPRSSKYKEVNGTAFFSGSDSTMSNQTSKWSNTEKNMPKNNSNNGGSGATKGEWSQSPQAINEFQG